MVDSNADAVEPRPTPLHILTTDIVLSDLISGRSIATDQGHLLVLMTPAARSALSWYRGARSKWVGNVQAADCEALISATQIEPEAVTASTPANKATPCTLRLVKIVAHRFAGLHGFGAPGVEVADFIFEPSRPITLFEGVNGSGKTSLLNAVVWCLTGKLYRPQRPPEVGEDDYQIEIDRGATTDNTQHAISVVTPLPSASWIPGAGEKVPADTWVELTFARNDGTLLPPVRRSQARTPRGKLTEDAFSAADLGVDPIALSLGTTMPGLLPYLQVGSASELGQALARLTGLSDLVDLAKHAGRAKVKIEGDIKRGREAEAKHIETEFQQHRTDLEARIAEFPSMKPTEDLPKITDPVEAFSALALHFESRDAEALADARSVLGEGFDAANPEHRSGLNADIGPAVELLRRVSSLPSMARLVALTISPEDCAAVEALLARIADEARELAQLATDPALARRTQLYARVTDWMRSHGHGDGDNCAVCRAALAGRIDPETGRPVSDHLREATDESSFLQRTIAQWAEAWTGQLARDLPEPLRTEHTKDLPADPATLFRIALEKNLFEADPFAGVLLALRPEVIRLIESAMDTIPVFNEPVAMPLPQQVAASAKSLGQALARIRRAIAFSYWKAENRLALAAALDAVRGKAVQAGARTEGLSGRLARLQQIVEGAAPISAAQKLTTRMTDRRQKWVGQTAAVKACEIAAAGIAEIIPVGNLAVDQIQSLQTRLQKNAESWRNQIYLPATTHTPAPRRTDMLAGGAIQFFVGREGVNAPAQHVSNASALRALLMGFYLALREHILKTRGGLELLILDDPQDLLDFNNRSKLSSALDRLAKNGTQILATTHDRNFARMLVAEARVSDRIEHRSIHPVHACRSTLKTSLAVEDLDRKRAAFKENRDSTSHARDYACEARIFLEARLGDLFDDPAYPAFSAPSDAPTLMSHVDRLRGLVREGSNELFRSPVMVGLAKDPAWEVGSPERLVLNKAHHAESHSITYPEVDRVDGSLKRLRAAAERAHEEFRRYRQREPLQDVLPNNAVSLVSIARRVKTVRIVPDLAAFSGSAPTGGSQDSSLEELTPDWFADKALFYIRHDTLGMAVPSGSVAIVDTSPCVPTDNQLVIARFREQTFARRLLRPSQAETFSLASDAAGATQRRPTITLDPQRCRVHRVVGVVFGDDPPPSGRDEAIAVEDHSSLGAIEVAYRVREDSAVPRVLPGQIVLVGRVLRADEIDAMVGQMAAITLEDGDSILKRIGAPISRSMLQLRHFETVGGLGASTFLASERIPGAPDVPMVMSIRPVLGVLYEA